MSEALYVATLNPSKWSWRVSNTTFAPVEIWTSGNRVLATGIDVEAEVGPDVITYSGGDASFKDLAGNPAASFEDFPIT